MKDLIPEKNPENDKNELKKSIKNAKDNIFNWDDYDFEEKKKSAYPNNPFISYCSDVMNLYFVLLNDTTVLIVPLGIQKITFELGTVLIHFFRIKYNFFCKYISNKNK